jgi:hypothetical protein
VLVIGIGILTRLLGWRRLSFRLVTVMIGWLLVSVICGRLIIVVARGRLRRRRSSRWRSMGIIHRSITIISLVAIGSLEKENRVQSAFVGTKGEREEGRRGEEGGKISIRLIPITSRGVILTFLGPVRDPFALQLEG